MSAVQEFITMSVAYTPHVMVTFTCLAVAAGCVDLYRERRRLWSWVSGRR